MKNMLTSTRLFFLSLCLMFASSAFSAGPVDFTLPDLEGKSHSLSDYRGKWVLVNYWATWCPPCREELPELEIFHSNSGGKAVVLGVNMEAIQHAELVAFVEAQFLSFPVLVAGPRPSPQQRLGRVTGLPTSFLISPDGRLVAKEVGPVTAKAIREFIQSYEQSKGAG